MAAAAAAQVKCQIFLLRRRAQALGKHLLSPHIHNLSNDPTYVAPKRRLPP
jgi:hypothetical protein